MSETITYGRSFIKGNQSKRRATKDNVEYTSKRNELESVKNKCMLFTSKETSFMHKKPKEFINIK